MTFFAVNPVSISQNFFHALDHVGRLHHDFFADRFQFFAGHRFDFPSRFLASATNSGSVSALLKASRKSFTRSAGTPGVVANGRPM